MQCKSTVKKNQTNEMLFFWYYDWSISVIFLIFSVDESESIFLPKYKITIKFCYMCPACLPFMETVDHWEKHHFDPMLPW